MVEATVEASIFMFITVQYLKRLYGTIFMGIFMGSVYIIKTDIYPFHNLTVVILKLFIAEAFQTECMHLLLFVVQSVNFTRTCSPSL